MNTIRGHLGRAPIVFLCAYGVRQVFFSGFVLGDDPQELSVVSQAFLSGPNLHDQLNLRFGVWSVNYLFFLLFGISETSFFLPTWLLSSSLPTAAYFLLIRWGYDTSSAVWGGLFVATAPFEVLLGTVRANDLFLAVALVGGLLAVAWLDRRPMLQGALLAFCVWFALYVKLWALYVLPGLLVYYAHGFRRERAWRSPSSFVVVSLLLHGVTILSWKMATGIFLPFIAHHPPTYPVPMRELGALFRLYPRMLFDGSEFGTTLFGVIPYLLLALLAGKTITTALPERIVTHRLTRFRLDRVDVGLLLMYGSFFLLLNFFPTSLTFDRYYSVQRIFRYLAPVSFPMTLHVAKMLCDVLTPHTSVQSRSLVLLRNSVFVCLVSLNLLQAHAATAPGRTHRQAFQAMLQDVRAARPVRLLTESWMGVLLRSLYLKEMAGQVISPPSHVHSARAYETWLRDVQERLPAGSMLVTGLGSYVHYGPHLEGLRLSQFAHALHPRWELVATYRSLRFLPVPETARLWRLAAPIAPPVDGAQVQPQDTLEVKGAADPHALYELGIRAFDRQDYLLARRYFQVAFLSTPDAMDARYFYAVTFYREHDWNATIRAFTNVLTNPPNRWTAAAHWHIGKAFQESGNNDGARFHFREVIDQFPQDAPLVALAREGLRSLSRTEGLLWRLWRTLKEHVFSPGTTTRR